MLEDKLGKWYNYPRMNATIKNIIRAVVQGAIFLVPVFLTAHPTLGDMTVSGIASVIVHYLDGKFVS